MRAPGPHLRQVAAEGLSSDGTRHVVAATTRVGTDGTFILYPLSTASGAASTYDIVIHGPEIQTVIIKAVPHNNARSPALSTIRLMRLIDCSSGSRDFKTTSCSGDEAVLERSSVAAINRALPSFTLAGARRLPESDEAWAEKLACKEGFKVLATIFPLLRNVASTPVSWLICCTVRSIETPLIT